MAADGENFYPDDDRDLFDDDNEDLEEEDKEMNEAEPVLPGEEEKGREKPFPHHHEEFADEGHEHHLAEEEDY